MSIETTIAEINKSVEGINKSAGTKIPVITATGLSETPTPIDVPKPKTATAGAGLAGAITSTTDAFTRQLAEKSARAEAGAKDSFDALISKLASAATGTELTIDANNAAGVDAANAELSSVNDQIMAEQRALQNKIDKLNENAEGFFGTGLAQEKERVTNESLRKQADLAIIQLSKQGKFDSAKAIADRAVAATLERQTNEIDTLKFIYEQNKDIFTKAEANEFEVAQKDRERDLNLLRDKELARYDALIKAQTTGVVGDGTNPLSSLPAYKALNAPQRTKADSLNNLIGYLKQYRTTYNDLVSRYGNKLTGEGAALLESQLNALLFAAAQAEGTGALQAADRAVLEKVLPNPTTLTGVAGALLRGGKGGGLSKIDGQIMKYTANLAGYGLTPIDNFSTVAPTSAAPSDTTLMVGPDGLQYDVPNDQVDAFLADGGKHATP